MLFALPLVLLAAPFSEPVTHLTHAPQDRRAEVKKSYEELAGARDAKGLAKLWQDNNALILQTIDADLEGSLSLWEKSPESPDLGQIGLLHQRALFGAEVASEATGNPIFADYAASFVGWDDTQKRSFRTGQALYRQALEQLEAGDTDVAHMKAMECRERALPLGDWWGTAMGYSAEGRALRAAGQLEEALVAHSQARLVYHDLGLYWNEFKDLTAMVGILRALERPVRTRVAASQAITMARALSDTDSELQLLRTRMWAEDVLGMTDAVVATAAEIAKLDKK